MSAESAPAAPRPVTPLGLLTALLDDLVVQVDSVSGVGPDFAASLREAWVLASGLDPYVAQCTSPESPELAELARRTRCEDWAGRDDGVPLEQEMLSGHVEGQLLKFLVHATRAVRVLEIGMFTGYSALAMAEALPPGGTVVACELDPYAAQFAVQAFRESPVGSRITVRVGPALDTLAALAAEGARFDLVFVDADKAGYAAYLDVLLESGLLAEHAVVCVDNTLMQGGPYGAGALTANGAAIAEFNRWVGADPRVEQVLVPLRDGLTLIRPVAGAC